MLTDKEKLAYAAERGDLSVRDMRSVDLSQVIAIENNAQASPWGRLSFEESLTNDYRCRVIDMSAQSQSNSDLLDIKPLDSNSRDNTLNSQTSTVVGYHVVSEIVDELHILNVVAAPALQGLGLGHMLMNDILEIAQQRCLKKIFLEVRASNEIAQSLYLKWQFSQIALRKQYYRPTSASTDREDAFVFLRQL